MADVTENSPQDIVNRYREPMARLATHLKWFKENERKSVQSEYDSSNMGNTIHFPVFDSNLLSFIRDCQDSGLMDRNWIYLYRRKNLPGWKDELEYIAGCDIMHMDDLNRILSKYVLGGQTKASVWSEGVEHGIFEAVVDKMNGLCEFWDHEN